MKMRLVILAAVISMGAALVTPAHANDCEAKAAEIVSKLGATVKSRSTSKIFLQHAAVPGELSIGCDSYNPADGPDVFLSWDTTDHPTDVFWSITGSMGAILIGASSRVIEDGARACYKRAKDGAEMADWARDKATVGLAKPGPKKIGSGEEPNSHTAQSINVHTHRSATVTRGDVRYECFLVSTDRYGAFNIDIFRR
jgi:hypothetical protein